MSDGEFYSLLGIFLKNPTNSHFRLLNFAEKQVAHNNRVDEFLLTYEIGMYLTKSGPYLIEVLVQLQIAPGATFRELAFLVPVLRIDRAAYGEVSLLTCH